MEERLPKNIVMTCTITMYHDVGEISFFFFFSQRQLKRETINRDK
jgi:hypothetical protein